MRKFTKILQVMVILLLSSSLAFAQSFQGEKAEKVYADKSPYSSNSVIPPSEVLFDLEFQFPPSGLGQAGIETDGIYFYTTKWDGMEFYRYGLDGTFLGSFNVTGAGFIRDLAYDGTYFYGSNASTTIGEMDFTPYNETLISYLTAPTEVRAIAYNEDLDLFYANNWGSDISCFDRAGVEQYSFPVGPVGDSYYGFAYDNYCGGPNPYLWGFAQVGATNNELIQIDLPTGIETGLYFDVGTLLGVTIDAIAGGLCIADNIVPGEWTLIGNCQGEWFWGLELCVPAPATLANDMVCALIDAPSTGELGATEAVTIIVFNKGTVAQSNIPVSFVYDGGVPVSEVVPGPIPQNGYETYTFTTNVDCSTLGLHTIMACTNLPLDEDVSNDCLTKTFNTLPSGDCQHQIDLYDDYGDGWNGGLLDVLVNGIVVLDDITLAGGAGPGTYYYYVSTGDVVTTQFTPGGWPYENWYEIYDDIGTFIIDDGTGGVDPLGITYNAICAGCCNHTICLTDDYGDGWNGGFVDIYVDGSPVLVGVTLATGLGPECFSFTACTGADIDVYYTAGGWPYENWYGVYDGGGTLLGESGAGGVEPTNLLDIIGNCPTGCLNPSAQIVTNITETTADLGWTENGSAVTWEYAYGESPNGPPAGAGTSTALNPVPISGLTATTTYDWYVRADCGGGDFSDWIGPNTFTTSSPPPPNDLCDDAEIILCNSSVNGSTTWATFDDVGFCGTSNTAPGVWYSFVATSITANLSTCDQANFDTKISVFQGPCDDLVCIGGQDDGIGCAGFTTSLDVTTNPGETYLVLVHGFSTATGDFTLTLTCPCYVDAGDCVTVYYGYDPAECTDLTASVYNATPPYLYEWSTGETTETITVCPMTTTTYSVTVTDAAGCVATDDVIVEVLDVRCGNKLNKVEICHIPPGNNLNPQTICISHNAVEKHLAHGDLLGYCGFVPCDIVNISSFSLKSTQPVVDKDDWNVYPNPAYDKAFIELSKLYEQQIQVTIFDMTGKAVWNHTSQILGSPVLEVNLEDMHSGIYQVVLRTNNQTMYKKLVITK